MIRFLLLAGMAMLLVACAPREHRPAGDWLEEREAFFREHQEWSVRGRLALSDGDQGGSLGFEWIASAEHHQIHLRTMMGGRQWRLDFGPGYALLEGSDVDQLIDENPDPLVQAAVGWPVPVTLLADWIRGLPAPPGARLRFAEDGTLEGLDHAIWYLEYQRLRPYNGILLPHRLRAESGQYEVRLVLSSWEFGP